MGIRSDIVKLIDVRTHVRCPKCGNPYIKRSSDGLFTSNGMTLFSAKERCTICRWRRITENVRIA